MSVPVQTSLAGLLAQTQHRVGRRIECALRAADMSVEQWRVLTLLADGAGHPMSEIATFAMVPAPTLTKIVDRLIDRGLVYRRVDTEDRRRVLVFLSSRGTELYHLVGTDVAVAERELADALGVEDANQLAELLIRLLEHLDSGH
ncbi:MAG TPA: MarR family transcriptional regulator [Pseudonocardia sp.]|uniref:MarR family winged helix-turn-helix transcriptional regulator n=1 Tax=Pseudonocardia sp. TaxID=60912 RepID=UPI002BD0099A|nr:MarR family transcriptional regulator [Pseudonocardia sp.]HTF55514.1 MarR family transcriptional regulator [Pseudonocardia sp.]